MDFRQVKKKMLQVLVPEPIEQAVRDKAHAGRRSQAEVATEALCRGFGRDPSEFGIAVSPPTPRAKSRRPKATASA